jgi:hypothetical protein
MEVHQHLVMVVVAAVQAQRLFQVGMVVMEVLHQFQELQ